jgi:hypothetical protein
MELCHPAWEGRGKHEYEYEYQSSVSYDIDDNNATQYYYSDVQ